MHGACCFYELGLALDEHGLGFLDPLLLLDELIRPVDVLSHVVHLRLERHVRGGGVARTGLEGGASALLALTENPGLVTDLTPPAVPTVIWSPNRNVA